MKTHQLGTIRVLLVLFALAAVTPAFAQNPCNAPIPALEPRGTTIFSAEQERFLGDVLEDQIRLSLRSYRRAELVAQLDTIANRLLKYLPNPGYQFRFTLVELPEANAFSMVGGRVFVSRRLIAAVQDEDELASILAHEMGHILARQTSVDVSKAFKDVLGVTAVGNRDDIFEKFNRLLDAANRKPGSVGKERDDQGVADRVAAEATWRAGYDPQALPRFFDRLAGNKGETGGFFSDLLGLTRPESKRFRDMLATLKNMSPACRDSRPETDAAAFKAWQKQVVELATEDLMVPTSTRQPSLRLSPKLRPTITNIRFSPDGAVLLAQDESGIHLLRREPFQYLFRIPALGAQPAIFHNDSGHLLFQTYNSRVEVWNIATRSRVRSWEPKENQSCDVSLPSPDGRIVACLSGPFENQVTLVDIEAGTEISKYTFPVRLEDIVNILAFDLIPPGGHFVQAAFSPDGSSFLASTWTAAAPWAFDLKQRSVLPIPSPLKEALAGSFAFLAPDRIATSHPRNPAESGTFTWPAGKPMEKFLVPRALLAPAASGATLMIRPFREYAVAVVNLEDKQVVQVAVTPALDRFGGISAAERTTGEIALYRTGETQPSSVLTLPESSLWRVRSAAISPDLNWMAASVRDRGTQWDLSSGAAILTNPFDNAHISAEGVWSASFEKRERAPGAQIDAKVVYRSRVNLKNRTEISSTRAPQSGPGHVVSFFGKYQVDIRSNPADRDRATFSVRDSSSDGPLWSRELERGFGFHLGSAVALQYDSKSKVADRIIKQSPELKRTLEAMRDRSDVALLEVLAADTGKTLGYVLVNNSGGAIRIQAVHAAGSIVFIEDSLNRTLAYSLDTGSRTGQQFGRVLAIDPTRGLAAVQNQNDSIIVFNGSMRPVALFEYPGNVIFAGFDGSGSRLFALTGTQDVFIDTLP